MICCSVIIHNISTYIKQKYYKTKEFINKTTNYRSPCGGLRPDTKVSKFNTQTNKPVKRNIFYDSTRHRKKKIIRETLQPAQSDFVKDVHVNIELQEPAKPIHTGDLESPIKSEVMKPYIEPYYVKDEIIVDKFENDDVIDDIVINISEDDNIDDCIDVKIVIENDSEIDFDYEIIDKHNI